MLSINHRTGSFKVDIQQDPYGETFWKNIESCRYEPDTLRFLEDNLTMNSVMMDVGAANGAMTLIAAQLGSRVYSYEPDPDMFAVLSKNLELNPKLNNCVILKNTAISTKEGEIEFGKSADRSILSDIVIGDNPTPGRRVEIVSLSAEIKRIQISSTHNLVIKMDIEGAEWRILNDVHSLASLKAAKAKVLLAVHPGFYRPHRKIFKGVDRIALTIWHLRNFAESRRTYKQLACYCVIKRTNLNPVRDAKSFAILVQGGYHEFILEF